VHLTPEDLEKLEAKKLANVIRKLTAGKTLTAREEAILSKAKSDGGSQASEEVAGYAHTWDELATALGVDERSLFNFRKRHAARIKSMGRVLTRADGRHCVAEWRKLGDELGELKGKGINNPDIEYIDERNLRLLERQLRVKRETFELRKTMDEMVPSRTSKRPSARCSQSSARRSTPSSAASPAASMRPTKTSCSSCSRVPRKKASPSKSCAPSSPMAHSGLPTFTPGASSSRAKSRGLKRTLIQCEYMEADPGGR
jgi:hypothetical protein